MSEPTLTQADIPEEWTKTPEQEARENKENNPPIYIRDVLQIQDPTTRQLDRLEELVESPVLPACISLREKGITTTLSGANKRDLERNIGGWITISYPDLSPKNRIVADELIAQGDARKLEENGEIALMVSVPALHGEDTTIAEVQEAMLTLTEKFESQPPIGNGVYTVEALRYEFGIDPNDKRYGVKELERIARMPLFVDEDGLIYTDQNLYQIYATKS